MVFNIIFFCKNIRIFGGSGWFYFLGRIYIRWVWNNVLYKSKEIKIIGVIIKWYGSLFGVFNSLNWGNNLILVSVEGVMDWNIVKIFKLMKL